ncbi:hypothetical protein AAHC03_09954 [Spirometra sp. Aus1]
MRDRLALTLDEAEAAEIISNSEERDSPEGMETCPVPVTKRCSIASATQPTGIPKSVDLLLIVASLQAIGDEINEHYLVGHIKVVSIFAFYV